MRIKKDGTRFVQDRNSQDFATQVLQLPTAHAVAERYANIAANAAGDFERRRADWDAQGLDSDKLLDVVVALKVFVEYLAEVEKETRSPRQET